VALCLLLLALFAPALLAQSKVEYVGGTLTAIDSGRSGELETADDQYLAFYCKGAQVRISYERVNLIEYGQKVDRRLIAAIVISPMFLLSKSRKHFLTIGYSDEGGKQQALVFRVEKNGIRPMLVILEARTGLKVQYQDPEARKAGKG
jgi:hypothetical protein